MLPGTDGIELMKDGLDVADMPVIFLSAYGREELIVRALDMVPQTTSSSTSRRRSFRRGSGRPCAGGRPQSRRSPMFWAADHRLLRSPGNPGRQSHTSHADRVPGAGELSANVGRVLTYERLLGRVWGEQNEGDVRPMRSIVNKLRRKLGYDAKPTTFIFTAPRVGYRMPRGEGRKHQDGRPSRAGVG